MVLCYLKGYSTNGYDSGLSDTDKKTVEFKTTDGGETLGERPWITSETAICSINRLSG